MLVLDPKLFALASVVAVGSETGDVVGFAEWKDSE